MLNLTPPNAHARGHSRRARRGKHIYTEKPLATTAEEGAELVAEAERLDLRIGCAPDTFLGSAYETGRGLIESGEIGEPLGFAATMLVGGPDSWHPNAEMFYRAGGGPMLDIAPYYLTAIAALVGPICSVAGFAATPTPDRTFGAGPRSGEIFVVEVPTLVAAFSTRTRRDRDVHRQLRGTRPVSERPLGLRRRGLARSARRERLRRGGDPRRARGDDPVTYASRGLAGNARPGPGRARRVYARRPRAPGQRRARAHSSKRSRPRSAAEESCPPS